MIDYFVHDCIRSLSASVDSIVMCTLLVYSE